MAELFRASKNIKTIKNKNNTLKIWLVPVKFRYFATFIIFLKHLAKNICQKIL